MRGVRGTLLQIGAPLLALLIVLVVCRVRGLPLRETLALRPPVPSAAVVWTVAFIALVIVEEVLSRTVFPMPVTPWAGQYAPPVLVLRVLGMVVLAPIAEEIVFRGLMYGQLSRTAVGPVGAVAISALAFSALHLQYGVLGFAFVLVDGLFYGAARAATDSVLLTIGLHALGNAYAAFQRVYTPS